MDTPSHYSVNFTIAPQITQGKIRLGTTEDQKIELDDSDVKGLEAGIAADDLHGCFKVDNDSVIEASEVLIVNWDGPDDPENPKNGKRSRKWTVVCLVSAYTFISSISSSLIAPAVPEISRRFGVTNTVVQSMLVSIFVLPYAFGHLLLGPLSEIFGRARPLQLANLFFLVFNIACGVSQNSAQFLAFRLLAEIDWGCVIGDCFAPEERGQAVVLFSLAPLLGYVIGPLTGSWVAGRSTGPWIFWSMTFAPVLLEQRARKIRVEMGLRPNEKQRVRTEYDTTDRK
ncbi:hypothetical protein M422DRAFT_52353 [Sphaerobolus stellatus SS14]|uniref:Major facilitator superfamily (MFS) profile domain-containing protein n=1 Tax=Sphaerobolus stellatus (strain SS14) TaxID=990650 RepID=A0A0C9V870_SPHS4|nr:hypothetical protein M422DRAFT_52353 [Sphaerobolus stellatus SS14]